MFGLFASVEERNKKYLTKIKERLKIYVDYLGFVDPVNSWKQIDFTKLKTAGQK